jgi:serine/threonine protein kinase
VTEGEHPHGSDRYRIARPLGGGRQGNTYEAVDVAEGKLVAVKLVTLRRSDWKQFDLFERECEVLEALDHPGIPRFIDTFSDEAAGQYALVMELVEGRSLKEMLDEQQLLSRELVWTIFDQALSILHYLHSLSPPVIHRDIKPANLILGANNKLSLVDFGGVRVALRPDGGSTVIGTFGYMAPEQLHGEATPATDLYGLGATIAALVTGTEADKLPHKGLKIDLEQVCRPGPLRDALTLMLEPDPQERPSSAYVVKRLIAELKNPKPSATAAATSPNSATAMTAPPQQSELEKPASADEAAGARVAKNVVGTLGLLVFSAVELVMLPVITALLSLVWSKNPRKMQRLRDRHERAKRWLSGSKQSMHELREGRRDANQLGSSGQARRLPPHQGQPQQRQSRGEARHERRGHQQDHGRRHRQRHGRRRNRR